MPISATRAFSDVTTGEELPPLTVPLDLTGIAAAAIATRDYQPVHHDPERARSLGSETVFMSTHATAGYIEKLVMSWAGPDAFLKSVKFRMGTPNYAGDVMTLTGRVASLNEEERSVVIEVVAANSRGAHADGTATLRLL